MDSLVIAALALFLVAILLIARACTKRAAILRARRELARLIEEMKRDEEVALAPLSAQMQATNAWLAQQDYTGEGIRE